MLIEFMVENYLSFKDKNTFSMIATKDATKNDKQVVNVNDKIGILKNAAIYGANASGKSNLLTAISFMKFFVINSSKESQQGDSIDVEAFKFSTFSENKASIFEVVFFVKGIIYRYGFEANKEKVISEWLFARQSSRESQLFVRNSQHIIIGDKFKEGKKYTPAVRENALFLSVCAQFNGQISSEILKWFRNVNIISSLDDDYVSITISILENKDGKLDAQREDLISLIKRMDFGIQNVVLSKNENADIIAMLDYLPMKMAKEVLDKIRKSEAAATEDDEKEIRLTYHSVNTVHRIYDEDKKFVVDKVCNFNIESKGTQKIFELAGPIIDTMYNGGVLLIDEIQSSLHTKLVIALIKFFVDNRININAQFIFTTHDVNILSADIFRRDQFWFVEKNKFGESDLTCLADFKEHVRKDARLDKDYLRGRYGAIPYLKLVE